MKKSKRTIIKFSASFVIITVLIILAWKLLITKEQLIEVIDVIRSFGSLGLLAYIAIYILLVGLSFPSTPFNIIAGIIFGLTQGLVAAVSGGLGAACAGFLLARFLFHDFMCKRIKKLKNGEQVLEKIENESPKVIAILRLNPFIPAVIKSYGLGITNIKFFTYVWATLLGQLPITFTYVYAGYVGGQAMLAEDGGPDAVHYSILAAGVILSLTLILYTRHYFKHIGDD